MLRKFFHIAFPIYLLAITIGVAVNKHYCGDEVVSLSVYLGADQCTGMGEAMNSSCCHDQAAFYQMEDDFVNKACQEFTFAQQFSFIIPEFTFLNEILISEEDSQHQNLAFYSPPNYRKDIPIEVQSLLL